MEYKSENKICQNCKQDFTIEPEDFGFYEKIKVPPPTFCPECRMIRKMSWRNERVLYKDKCKLCNKHIITVYDPNSNLNVYCRECWISDKWDAGAFGREFEWDKDFMSQFSRLLREVPLFLLDMKGLNSDSEYCNYSGGCKNCYLCFSVVDGEDSKYISNSQDISQCFDASNIKNSELCNQAVESEKVYSSVYVEQSKEVINSSFIFGSSNVGHCFMVANLRNQNYVFRNEKLTRDQFIRNYQDINSGSFKNLKNLITEFDNLKKEVPHKYADIKNSLRVVGNNIINSKDVYKSFNIEDSENIRYSYRILSQSKDVYDCNGMKSGELMYESFGAGYNPAQSAFSFSFDQCREVQYSAMCNNCSNCFGCVGLQNKSYCILNKQYTKKEYEELVPKIIEQMNKIPYVDKKGRIYKYGEFFPTELSLFAYNETIAQEYFPINKNKSVEYGFLWKERDLRNYSIDIEIKDLPDCVADTDDSIINKVIECAHSGLCEEQCTEAFKIISEEFNFYKKMNLALPRLCPNCRHFERLKKRNPMKLWHRQCMCDKTNHSHHDKAQPCPHEFETSYSPDRPEIVYCEKCYQQEVY